jgi:hypothetical protein
MLSIALLNVNKLIGKSINAVAIRRKKIAETILLRDSSII